MRFFPQTTRADGPGLDSDTLNSLALNRAAMMSSRELHNQPINRQLRESAPAQTSGSVEGSDLPGNLAESAGRERDEARNLERFVRKAGFEALSTRFQDANLGAEPSDSAG
jgi:hypothetical protein